MPGRVPRFGLVPTLDQLVARIENLERGSGTRAVAQRPAPELVDSRSAEVVVAAADSTDKAKLGADYVCEGTADEVVIQAAHDEIRDAGDFGKVRLLAGGYVGDGPVTVEDGMSVEGSSKKATFSTTAGACFVLNGFSIDLSNMSLDPWGTTAVDGTNASNSNLHHLYTQNHIYLGFLDTISDVWMGALYLTGPYVQAVNCFLNGRLDIAATAYECQVANLVQETIGPMVVMRGSDNYVANSSFYSRDFITNTNPAVSIDGIRNNFCNNVCRGHNPGYPFKYAIQVEAAAVEARAKYNDLRAGEMGGWGTGLVNDLGTASLVSDNDS